MGLFKALRAVARVVTKAEKVVEEVSPVVAAAEVVVGGVAGAVSKPKNKKGK